MNKPLHILLIEDSLYDAELLKMEIANGGFEADYRRVETVEELWDALNEEQPWDLILCDYLLPKLDAPHALDIIKESGLDIPFIIVSGKIGEETAINCMKKGAHDFLIKGYLSRLIPAIERELNDVKERKARRKAEEEVQNSYENLKLYAVQMEQSKQELEDFVFMVSHNLQAPLRKILTFSDHLKLQGGNSLDAGMADDIERLYKNTERMREMIDDLLEYSQVSRSDEPFREVPLQQIIENFRDPICEILAPLHGDFDVMEPLPDLHGNPTQIRELMEHLVDNALKFRNRAGDPNNGPYIKIYAEPAKEEGFSRIVVEDNGIGIEPAYKERIFNAFFRLNAEEDYPGTGIGLTLARKIAERHGGTIDVESTPGQGSKFIATLPLKTGTDAVPALTVKRAREIVKSS